MVKISEDHCYKNAKLEKLRSIILRKMSTDSTGMIFYPSVIVGKYIERWMKGDRELSGFMPERIVQVKSEESGISN